MKYPSEANQFLAEQAECIRDSYLQLFGKDLLADANNETLPDYYSMRPSPWYLMIQAQIRCLITPI